jgi:hypothetical protein
MNLSRQNTESTKRRPTEAWRHASECELPGVCVNFGEELLKGRKKRTRNTSRLRDKIVATIAYRRQREALTMKLLGPTDDSLLFDGDRMLQPAVVTGDRALHSRGGPPGSVSSNVPIPDECSCVTEPPTGRGDHRADVATAA